MSAPRGDPRRRPHGRYPAPLTMPSGTASIRAGDCGLSPTFCTGLPTASQQLFADRPATPPRPFFRDLRTPSQRCAEGARAPPRAAAIFAAPPGPQGPSIPPQRNPTRSRSTTPVHTALEHTWSQIQAELRRAVTDSTYHLWLAPLRARAIDGDALLVGAPEEIRTWVADRFARVLADCAARVLGEATTVTIVSLEAPLPGEPTPPPSRRGPPLPGGTRRSPPASRATSSTRSTRSTST